MRILFTLFAGAALCCAVWGTVAAVRIAAFLDERGIKTPFFLFRVYVFRNISRYKKITTEETGKPGGLYGHCVYAFSASLVFALAALAVRFLAR